MARFIPEGSYQKTSQNIYVNLYCDAQKADQSWTTASYPICALTEPNAGLVNWNGSLAPAEGSYPDKGFIPSGSYAATCKNVKVVLTAECKKISGNWQFSALDITNYDYGQGNVVNIDGTLVDQAKIIAQYFGIFDDWYKRSLDQNPPFDKLNRLYIAFAWIKNGLLTYEKEGDGEKIDDLVAKCRNKNPNAEILISSGFDDGTMYKYAAKDTQKFAQSVVDFINTHNLNGYDMDWENGIEQKGMNDLLGALRKAFDAEKKQYKLTLAVWPQPEDRYDLGSIAKYVDQINIMTYGHDRPLSGSVPAYYNSGNGIPYEKIIGGIETEIDYKESGGPDTLGNTGSIKQKCDYALNQKLGGMMEWRLDNDLASGVKPTFNGAKDLYQYMKANVGK